MADPKHSVRPPEGIHRGNFAELLRDFECGRCLRIGMWELETVPNNGGARLRCRCGHRPWPTHFLKKDDAPIRRKALGISTADFWEEHGNYCYGCGLDYRELQTLHIGCHVHHTVPYSRSGHEGVKIPLCAGCHQAITTIQQRYADLLRELAVRRANGDAA